MSKITTHKYDNQDVRFLTDDNGELWVNFNDFMAVNQPDFETKH